MSQTVKRQNTGKFFVRKYKSKTIQNNENCEIIRSLKLMTKQELINQNIKLREEITMGEYINT